MAAHQRATTNSSTAPESSEVDVNSFWKPLAWFTKGRYTGRVVNDVIEYKYPPLADDKLEHPWEQALSGMRAIIERFAEPGQLVLDPLVGTGTVGVAALGHGCRFVGIDIDEAVLAVAAERLALAVRA